MAQVVQRAFHCRDHAGGNAGIRRFFLPKQHALSPKKIAEALNAEGIAPPSGRYWGASTIHGNRQRGTGILNNELYIGRQIWNRLNYRKDPSTGKRISRLNPESAWVITEVPALRIIEQELSDRVRTRQGALTLQSPLDKPWDRRRPRTLFSGLMTCGCCGGGIAKVSKSSFGCSSARNKGKAVCANMRTIAQTDLEARVLNALTNHLMDPEALAVFCETYADERNRLRREAEGARETLERSLTQTKRDHQKLVDAIVAGVPAEQVKDRMIALDQQRQQLERRVSASPAPDPILIHPSMAVTYRERVAALIAGLGR
ncbi:recombinase family protein, partial [Tritonibacter mobilis]